jgi:hypothetical protein
VAITPQVVPAKRTAMDSESKPEPTAATTQSLAPRTGDDAGRSNLSPQTTAPKSVTFTGVSSTLKDNKRVDPWTMGARPGSTMLASHRPDGLGRSSLNFFKKHPEASTMKDTILVPKEDSRQISRHQSLGAVFLGHDTSKQEVTFAGTERPVNGIDVIIRHNQPASEQEVASLVPQSVINLCEPKWEKVGIELHQGEVPTEGSGVPDSVVSQG